MWEKVNKNSIRFTIKNQGKIVIPRNSLEIVNGFRMLEYIFTEEKNNFFPKNFDFSKDAFDVEDRIIGFSVRINAYVNILCNLEKIVEKTYIDFRKYIESLKYKKILPKVGNKPEERKKEIENFLFWRNKVFAHTAYTNPNRYFFSSNLMKELKLCEECKKKLKEKNKEGIENDSTRLTALAYFGGSILGYGKKSFQIGGATNVVISPISNEEIKPISFPVIDIAENHSNIINHFEEWEKMFVEILEKFRDIDEKNIIKKM